MSNEANNVEAIELSLDELDTVAGGLSLIFGNIGGFMSSASSSFYQKTINIAQQTYAGPDVSYTSSVFSSNEVASSARQDISIT